VLGKRVIKTLNYYDKGFVALTEAAAIFLWTSFLRASGSRHDIPFCLCLFSEFSECVSGDEVASVIEEIVDLTMS
jgi:hypothetical protein